MKALRSELAAKTKETSRIEAALSDARHEHSALQAAHTALQERAQLLEARLAAATAAVEASERAASERHAQVVETRADLDAISHKSEKLMEEYKRAQLALEGEGRAASAI